MSTWTKAIVAVLIVAAILIAVVVTRKLQIAEPEKGELSSPPRPVEPDDISRIAEFPFLTPEQRKTILAGDFVLIGKVTALPKPIQRFYRDGYGVNMADPGDEFQATDVIYKQGLPLKRLIVAGISRDRCFVESEHGGFAAGYDFAVFDISGKPKLLWSATPRKPIPDLDELRRAVADGKL